MFKKSAKKWLPVLGLMVLALFSSCAGCHRNRTPGRLKIAGWTAERFADLYAKSLTIRNSTLAPRQREAALVMLYREFDLDTATYNRLLAAFQQNPALWQQVLTIAREKLTKEEPQEDEFSAPR